MTDSRHATTLDRQRTMLRTAMGPAITDALTDPAVIEVMVNPDGRLWLDRHGDGRIDTGEELGAADVERIIRLVASHIGQECHKDRPVVSAELPESGERFEGLLPPVAASPCFAIRKPANVLYRLTDYVETHILTAAQAKTLEEAVEARKNIVVVGGTMSGSGETARAHVLVKPIAEDLKTNLIIITDRRAYHLELVSTPETYMASASWHYPHDELVALKSRNLLAKQAADRIVASGLDLDRLRFSYAISGDAPPWRPMRVFDDTSKVYIQFPARLDQGEAPPLFVVGPDGGNQLVNYRIRGRYYVVDRLFAAAELRLGEDPQQVVRITRTDGQPVVDARSGATNTDGAGDR